jgi:pimeloyl-ACP methyl ester carboxylesterase
MRLQDYWQRRYGRLAHVAGSSRFVDNDGVRIHAIDNGRVDESAPPVLVVPGMGEYADEYTWLLDALGERRVVVVDVRGRGRSDVPETGYRWEDHIGDLRAVVDATGLDRPVVVAFSRGSSYALGYALQFPEDVRGLVIGDYFARHVGLPVEFAEQQLRSKLRGVPISERMPEHAVRQVFVEGREVPLWDRLVELRCPVLVIRGGRKGALVGEELAAQWRASLPSVELALIADAGHDLWSRDVDAYLAVLLPFLERVSAP